MRISPASNLPQSTLDLSLAQRAKLSIEITNDSTANQFDWRLPSPRDQWAARCQACITSLPLLISDMLSASVAFTIAYELVAVTRPAPLPPLALGLAGLLLLSTIALGGLRLYPGVGLSAADELRLTCKAFLFSHLGLLLAAYTYSAAALLVVAGSCVLTMISAPLGRRATRAVSARFPAWGQRVLMFGDQGDAEIVYRAMLAHPEQGLRPVGIVDMPRENWRSDEHEPDPRSGPLAEAANLARASGVAWGIVPIEQWEGELTLRRLDRIASIVHHLLLVLPECGDTARQVEGAHWVGDIPTLRVDARLLMPLHSLIKRAMDLTLLALGGVLVLPLMALLAIGVRRSSPGSIFYGQERLGRGGRAFKAWKFRSMVQNADQVLEQYLATHPELKDEWRRDHKLKVDPRITKIGRFLRKASLDELPQLWNVLRGEMSLVGPRPIVQAEVGKYADYYSLYTSVRPGITGLWQVSGRNNTSYETRVALDARYVRNWSIWLDIYLLARTVKVVLNRDGAY